MHTFTKGNLCLAFGRIRGKQRSLPATGEPQLPSGQNNPYAKVAFSGMAYPDPLQVNAPLRNSAFFFFFFKAVEMCRSHKK